MANSKSEEGILKILASLSDADLFGLAATVTQGLLKNKLTTRAGAIEAIVKYSPDILSILKRKVITREVLFSYAHAKNLEVTLPAHKNDIIDLICQDWQLKCVSVSCVSDQSLVKTTKEVPPSLDVNTMALKFCEWFYAMMNSIEPIGVEHFWHDAKLKMQLVFPSGTVTPDVGDNAENISQLLFRIKCDYNLYFNPNFLSEGVQGRIDPHGLVVILACGTLHVGNNCVGVFEEVFMLARDPFSDNNWKIKSTELNLRSSADVKGLPRLCDSGLTANLLALPQS